jgi:hypothetical protein
MGLVKIIAVRFIKGHWGSILPGVFKAAAEGDFGPQVRAVYWFASKYKTVTGAVLWGAGAALETVCGNYPTMGWACHYAVWPYYIGMVLTGVGLADGGTRSPYPAGTVIAPEAKTP